MAIAETAGAQDLPSQTLASAISRAIEHSPTIVSAQSRLDGSEAEIVVSRADGLPSVDGSVRYNYDLGQDQNVGGNGISVSSAINVPLFQGGSVRNSVLAAEAQRDASIIGIAEVESEVILATSRAYLDVLRDRQIVALNRENVRNLSTMLSGLRMRLEARDLTRTDVDQADSRLALAQGRLEVAIATMEASEVEFERLTGSRPDKLAPFPHISGVPLTPDNAVEAAVSENPAIIAARSAAQASRFSLNSAKGERLPQLFATVNNSFASSPSSLGPNNRSQFGTSIGVAMRMSLFAGGRQGASERIAAARVTQAEQQLLDLERKVAAKTRATYAEWMATRAVVEASKEAVRANDKALQGVRLENAVGTRTILEILNAEQELRDAQIQLLNAERDYAVANVSLLASIGKARVGKFDMIEREENQTAPLLSKAPDITTISKNIIDGPAGENELAQGPELPAIAVAPAVALQPMSTTAPVSAVRSGISDWAVQMGAFGELKLAMHNWQNFKTMVGDPELAVVVFRANVGGRNIFRRAFVGLHGWDHAQKVCLKIKQIGQNCLVRRSGQLGEVAWDENHRQGN